MVLIILPISQIQRILIQTKRVCQVTRIHRPERSGLNVSRKPVRSEKPFKSHTIRILCKGHIGRVTEFLLSRFITFADERSFRSAHPALIISEFPPVPSRWGAAAMPARYPRPGGSARSRRPAAVCALSVRARPLPPCSAALARGFGPRSTPVGLADEGMAHLRRRTWGAARFAGPRGHDWPRDAASREQRLDSDSRARVGPLDEPRDGQVRSHRR